MSPQKKRTPAKIRKASPSSLKRKITASSLSLKPVFEKLPPGLLISAFGVFLALGYFFLDRDLSWLGAACLVLCLVTAWKINRSSQSSFQFFYFFAWISGLVIFLNSFVELPSMTRYLPWALPFHPISPWPAAMVGLMLVLLGFAGFKDNVAKYEDLNPWAARFCLGVLLAVTAWVRLRNTQGPWLGYDFDSASLMMDARNVCDFPYYRQLFFYDNASPPFDIYYAAGWCALFPKVSSIVLQKYLMTSLELITFWVHYLLGKELGGRRVGLFLVLALATSKPLLVSCISGCNSSILLAVGFILLFTFRFLKNPDLKHALQWGVMVGFGGYFYTTVRTYLWLAPVILLAVALWHNRKAKEPWPWVLGTAVITFLTYLFFFINGFLPRVLAPNRFVLWSLLAVLAWFFYKATKTSKMSSGVKELLTVVIGVCVMCLVFYPIGSNPVFSSYASQFSIFNKDNPAYPQGGMSVSFLLYRAQWVFGALFSGVPDNPKFSFPGEAFFNLASMPWIVMGLAWWLGRPSWKGAFLVLGIGVGALPYLLSFDGSTGRLRGLITPLFLLGAIGFDVFWRRIRTFPGGRFWPLLGLAVLLLYGKWAVEILNYRDDVLWAQQPSRDEFVFEQIRKDTPKYRIYLWADGLCNDQTISVLVDEGEVVYGINTPGALVPQQEGAKLPDVVVYMDGTNSDNLKRMEKAFPQARVEEVHCPGVPGYPLLVKLYIEGKDLKGGEPFGNKPYFSIVDIPEGAWCCRTYKFNVGLGHGVIRREDWLTGPLGPLPDAHPLETVSVEGTMSIPKDGKCRFSVGAGNCVVMEVDGRRVFDYRPSSAAPSEGKTQMVELKTGVHRVLLRSCLQIGIALPEVKVRFPGETTDRPLGSF